MKKTICTDKSYLEHIELFESMVPETTKLIQGGMNYSTQQDLTKTYI